LRNRKPRNCIFSLKLCMLLCQRTHKTHLNYHLVAVKLPFIPKVIDCMHQTTKTYLEREHINDCRSNFSFMLPSEMIEMRQAKLEGKFNICNSLSILWFIVEHIVAPSVVTVLTLFIYLSFLFYLFFDLSSTDCIFSVNKDYQDYHSILLSVTRTLCLPSLSRYRSLCKRWELFFVKPGVKVNGQY